jgi:hypothetical protein
VIYLTNVEALVLVLQPPDDEAEAVLLIMSDT